MTDDEWNFRLFRGCMEMWTCWNVCAPSIQQHSPKKKKVPNSFPFQMEWFIFSYKRITSATIAIIHWLINFRSGFIQYDSASFSINVRKHNVLNEKRTPVKIRLFFFIHKMNSLDEPKKKIKTKKIIINKKKWMERKV